MHRSTTVTTSPPWWKQPTVSKTIPQSAPQVELAQEYIPHNDACPTVTENAAMTGAVRVLSNEEASAKGYFSNSLGQRPCSLEERTKYFNGLGYDVVIFDLIMWLKSIPPSTRLNRERGLLALILLPIF